MTASDAFLPSGEIHPIDIVEAHATDRAWDFDRLGEDQIAMAVEGLWRTYSVTLSWSAADEMLRLIATFEFDPPEGGQDRILDLLARANDMVWGGGFHWWPDQKLMVWRYGLMLAGGQIATPEQVGGMIAQAIRAAERFYPAFQMCAWGEATPDRALQVALAEAYGRA